MIEEFVKNWKVSKLASPACSEAIRHLNTFRFPNRKDEEWKYTRLNKLEKLTLRPCSFDQEIDLKDLPDLKGIKMVFVNGFFRADLSSFDSCVGLTIAPLSHLEQHSDFTAYYNQLADTAELFSSLNTGYASDGVYIKLDKNTVVDKPIHIVHHTCGEQTISNFRLLCVADKHSKASVVVTYSGGGAGFTNVVSEVFCKEGANLQLDKIQLESGMHHIANEWVSQNEDSQFRSCVASLNGNLIRNNQRIFVKGKNCHTDMYGLFLSNDGGLIDNHTKIDHIAPHCTSNEVYKGILAGKSTGVFNGKIKVYEDAQKIEAYQQNKNVLLSTDASMNAKPELEIYADDVKCSHGTTTGQFDNAALFYLRARGISEMVAKQLLVEAFVGDVVESFKHEEVRSFLNDKIQELLA